MLPNLYKELGFEAGKSKMVTSYREEIESSNLNFEIFQLRERISNGKSCLRCNVEKMNYSHKVKVSDFWMGKYEVTWDEYELWMINLDKDNREYNKKESDKSDTLSDAVAKPTAPYVDEFRDGKSGHPAIV